MARDEKPADKGRVKVRVIEFEMEGSNQTLRDSIRDIVGAIGRSPPVVRREVAHLNKQSGEAKEQPEDEAAAAEMEYEEEPLSEIAESSSRPRKSRPPKSPEILDIDLKSGDQPLKTFLEKINPDTDTTKYVTIAYWLKEQRGIKEVTADHVHTAYRHMGWRTPDDASMPLRNLKSRQYNYMGKGEGTGAYAINHIGENKVHEMMQKAGVV